MSIEPHDNEFEHWLRDESERHRLFADESVWDRIQQRLNRRRWFPLVLSLLLITSGAVSWVMITNPAGTGSSLASAGLRIDRSATMTKQPEGTLADADIKQMVPFKKTGHKPPKQTVDLAFLTWAAEEAYEANESRTSASASNLLATEKSATPASIAVAAPVVQLNRINILPAAAITIAESKPMQPTDGATAANNQGPSAKQQTTSSAAVEGSNMLPEQIQTIESVVNTYKGKRTRKSWQLQFNISPTVSYRKLIEDAGALQAARSIMNAAPAMAVPEFESVVEHKPDLGLQMGVSFNRQLTKRIDFVGGLQFNINKYDIRAYAGNREVATVGLNSGGATGSVSSFTNYRSSGGAWANWLANFYFSASAPIGFQVRLAGNKKWNWGIGSTLQPTCILSNQTYILSTDYKNYLEVPSLVRRWNLNGQAETFIGFQGKKLRYTLGPQARYQILSSFDNAYPVQEHLFDIGIKLGIGL